MALGMNGEETMTYPSSVRTEKKPVSINQTTSLGFVGLGSMGLPIATNMQRSGHEMHLYDVDASKISALTNEKTHIRDSPKDVADNADIVFTCLPSLSVANEVATDRADSLIHGSKIKTLVTLGTTGSEYGKKTSEELAKQNIRYLDSPISGGPVGARAATLSIMCSGDLETFQYLKAHIYPHTSQSQFYLGEKPGLAQVMKLVNNINLFMQLAGTLESLTLGEKAGLDPNQMIDVINASSGLSRSSEVFIPKHILNHEYNFGATNAILLKDLELWAEEIKQFTPPDSIGRAAMQVFQQSIEEHGLDADLTNIYKTLRKSASLD